MKEMEMRRKVPLWGLILGIVGLVLMASTACFWESSSLSDAQKTADALLSYQTDGKSENEIARYLEAKGVSRDMALPMWTAYVSLQRDDGKTRPDIKNDPGMLYDKIKSMKGGSSASPPCPCIEATPTPTTGCPCPTPTPVPPTQKPPAQPKAPPPPAPTKPSAPPTSACNATSNFGSPVVDGTTLSTGTCAVIEVDDWSAKTVVVFGGVIIAPFFVNDKGTPQTSAWVHYSSVSHAQTDACTQAKRRMADPLFAGFTFTVTSGGCDLKPSAPAPASTATPIPPSGNAVQRIPLGTNVWMDTQISIPTTPAASNEMYVAHGDVKGKGFCNLMTWGPGTAPSGLSAATWTLVLLRGGTLADRQAAVEDIRSIAARQTGSCPNPSN